MISILFIISLLSDLFKLISYLKENFHYRVKKRPFSFNKEVLKEKESVFRQVIEKVRNYLIILIFKKEENQCH